MFLKLALCCFDAWGNDLSPRHPGLSRFKEKYEVLRSARVDFPEDRQLYTEGLKYILGSLKHLEISHCDFTADFSDMPSRVEASILNISVPKYDDILPDAEETTIKRGKPLQSTSVHENQKTVTSQKFLEDDSFSRKDHPSRYQVDCEIQEVMSSQEYSDIVNPEDGNQSLGGPDNFDQPTINRQGYDFSKQKASNVSDVHSERLKQANDLIEKLRDEVKLLREGLATVKAGRL